MSAPAEWCFRIWPFWCLPDTMWGAVAAWVQAVGSVGAIAFSIVLWRSSAREVFRRSASTAAVFTAQLLPTLELLKQACENQHAPSLQKQASIISEVVMLGRAVAYEHLGPDSMQDFFELRSIAARAAQLAEVQLGSISWEHARGEYAAMLADARLAADKLGRRVEKWPLALDDGKR